MERRRELRVEANEPVVVTELGGHRRARMGGMLLDMSGGGLLVKLPRSIKCGAAVRVEASNMLALGDVVRCEPDADQFRVAIVIHHSLRELQDLENLNRALIGEERASRETPAFPPSAPIMKV